MFARLHRVEGQGPRDARMSSGWHHSRPASRPASHESSQRGPRSDEEDRSSHYRSRHRSRSPPSRSSSATPRSRSRRESTSHQSRAHSGTASRSEEVRQLPTGRATREGHRARGSTPQQSRRHPQRAPARAYETQSEDEATVDQRHGRSSYAAVSQQSRNPVRPVQRFNAPVWTERTQARQGNASRRAETRHRSRSPRESASHQSRDHSRAGRGRPDRRTYGVR